MTKDITLRKASELDDLRCTDGELEGSDFLFETPDDPDDESTEGTDGSHRKMLTDTEITLPEGAEWIAMHHPAGHSRTVAVIRLPGGTVAWSDGTLQFRSFGAMQESAKSAVTIGEWLCILTRNHIFYALWNGAGYVWVGEAPEAPVASFSAWKKPLPPYSGSGDELPSFSLAVADGKDINAAIQARRQEFVEAAERAGLFLSSR